VATGRPTVKLGEGPSTAYPSLQQFLVSADGKLASLVAIRPAGQKFKKPDYPPWVVTEFNLEAGEEKVSRLEYDPNKLRFLDPPRHLSPDSKHYARLGIGGDKSIPLWSAADGKLVHVFEAQTGLYTALAFTPDGKSVVLGDQSHTLRVFNLATGVLPRSRSYFSRQIAAVWLAKAVFLFTPGISPPAMQEWRGSSREFATRRR
jgi:WD40 repeat protein